MSLQNPLKRLALRPLNGYILPLPRPSSTTRVPTRRPFSVLQQTQAQKQTPLQSQLQNTFLRNLRNRRAFHSSRSRFNNNGKSSGPGYTYQSPNATPSLSQRLKTLSREYGWSALWIYLFLSALDFPFCFAAVKLFGADKIGHYEHVVVEGFKNAVNKVWPGAFEEKKEEDIEAEAAEKEKKKGRTEEASMSLYSLVMIGNGANYCLLGVWTQLALAYAIHKSFIFVRVPLTAAITPKVVKQLRKWGWDVVKGKPKAK
ncbi:hypothetical protein BDV18DRAFT_86428 [Aspergillus unguis]